MRRTGLRDTHQRPKSNRRGRGIPPSTKGPWHDSHQPYYSGHSLHWMPPTYAQPNNGNHYHDYYQGQEQQYPPDRRMNAYVHPNNVKHEPDYDYQGQEQLYPSFRRLNAYVPPINANYEPAYYYQAEQELYPPAKRMRLEDGISINSGYAYKLSPRDSENVGWSNVLQDTTNKVFEQNWKANWEPQYQKATKEMSIIGNIADAFDKNSKDTKKPMVIEANQAIQKKRKLTVSPVVKKATESLRPSVPEGVTDFDKKTEHNIFAVLPWMHNSYTLFDNVNHKPASYNQTEEQLCPPAKRIHLQEGITANSANAYKLPPQEPGKVGESNFLQDTTTNKVLGVKRKAEATHQNEKAVKKKSKLTGSSVLKKVTLSPRPSVLEGIEDFDKGTENDLFAVADYVKEIFQYYKDREYRFKIDKYIHRHPEVSESMRAILVDWMVQVQQSFKLYHETLYLAVKIVDIYLSKTVYISREIFQLIGSTAIFIACKFDEPNLPYLSDFLHICDDAYTRKDLISMEVKILITTAFDLGIPISYRFLRRYARCGKMCMQELTLARYILELSLMDYELINASDSMLATSALFLAKAIKGDPTWNHTLAHYSGYNIEDIHHIVYHLHNMLCQPPKDHIKTIHDKYSHKLFFEVAKITVPKELDI